MDSDILETIKDYVSILTELLLDTKHSNCSCSPFYQQTKLYSRRRATLFCFFHCCAEHGHKTVAWHHNYYVFRYLEVMRSVSSPEFNEIAVTEVEKVAVGDYE